MPTRYIGDGYWEIISRQMSIVTVFIAVKCWMN